MVYLLRNFLINKLNFILDESIVIRDPKTLENLKAVERGAGEQVKTQSLEDNLVK